MPIVAVSASVQDEYRQKSREAGGQAFLSKPIQLERLLDILEHQLAIQWNYAPEHRADETVPYRQNDWQNLPLHAIPPDEDLYVFQELLELGKIYEINQGLDHLETADPAYEPFIVAARTLTTRFLLADLSELLQYYLNNRS